MSSQTLHKFHHRQNALQFQLAALKFQPIARVPIGWIGINISLSHQQTCRSGIQVRNSGCGL